MLWFFYNFDTNWYYNCIKVILSRVSVKHIINKKNVIIIIKICLSDPLVKHTTNKKNSLNRPPIKDNINSYQNLYKIYNAAANTTITIILKVIQFFSYRILKIIHSFFIESNFKGNTIIFYRILKFLSNYKGNTLLFYRIEF